MDIKVGDTFQFPLRELREKKIVHQKFVVMLAFCALLRKVFFIHCLSVRQ